MLVGFSDFPFQTNHFGVPLFMETPIFGCWFQMTFVDETNNPKTVIEWRPRSQRICLVWEGWQRGPCKRGVCPRYIPTSLGHLQDVVHTQKCQINTLDVWGSNMSWHQASWQRRPLQWFDPGGEGSSVAVRDVGVCWVISVVRIWGILPCLRSKDGV